MQRPPGRHAYQSVTQLTDAFAASVRRGATTVSVKIVYVCVSFFIALALLDAVGVVDRQTAISFLGLSYYGVTKRLWIHQFITAPLLHAGVVHLAFNMLALWWLGPSTETLLGRSRYLVLTFICAGSSMLAAFVLTAGTPVITLGYSGIVFGILVVQAVFFPDRTIIVFWFFPMRMRHAVLLFGAMEFYLTVAPEREGIANASHLAGALAAFVYLRGIRWSARSRLGGQCRHDDPSAGFKARRRESRKTFPDKL